MAAGFTSYSVDNDKLFRQALERAKEEVKNLTIPLKLISKDFYRSEQAIFNLQGPGKYPDLSAQYKIKKQKKVGFTYPILKSSGILADSLLSPDALGSINEIINQDTLIIGTSIAYGIYHQSDAPRKKIPLRKFLFIGPEAPSFATSDQQGRAERWLNILNSYVLAKMQIVGEVAGIKVKP